MCVMDEIQLKKPVCEVCGKPATRTIQDVWRVQNDKLRIIEFEPQGIVFHYCDEHKRESRIDDK